MQLAIGTLKDILTYITQLNIQVVIVIAQHKPILTHSRQTGSLATRYGRRLNGE